MDESYAGRGPIATTDMKARIAALKAQGITMDDIIAILWERANRAERGDGYDYQYAGAEAVRPDGQLRQPAGR
jgi:hypothetical protein